MVSRKEALEYFQKNKKFHPDIVEEENLKAQERVKNVKVWSEPKAVVSEPEPEPEPVKED